jgi:soluble lytic murein transglycosylase
LKLKPETLNFQHPIRLGVSALARLSGSKRIVFILIGIAIVIGGSLPPLLTASCLTRQNTPAEIKALADLRAMTRGGVLPAENVVTQMELQFAGTKAAALARIVRARIHLDAKDFVGAASLLNAEFVHQHSSIGDYVLIMRANALEQAGRNAEALVVYQKLIDDYPSSLLARPATLSIAELSLSAGNRGRISALLRGLIDQNDPAGLLLAAKAQEQSGDQSSAASLYRRLYFYAPASAEAAAAPEALARLRSSTAPANKEEAQTRADKLYEARKYNDAFQAYTDSLVRFPAMNTPSVQLRRGTAAASQRKNADAIAALSAIPSSAGEVHAEALFQMAQTYARARQWDKARSTVEELRRAYPNSTFAPNAFVTAGRIAEDAKNSTESAYFLRTAVASFKGAVEVAQAQFDLAWDAHEAKNYAESSRLLTEHLAFYVDKNNDNRGRAGYWAARDSERAGKLPEARALYQAMLGRYDANWYGYLAKQRLEALGRRAPEQAFAPDSLIGRAVANLQIVTVAEEAAGTDEEVNLRRSDELANVGLVEWAIGELAPASEAHPDSPRINLAIARIYRGQDDNVRALNTLRRSFPDYSQMKPEELTREQWDVFYPLAYWDVIVQESRARNLDPFQVAGLIRQETIFNPKARSSARAYGLMQVLVPTAALTARRYGFDRSITAESLYEPRLNIQLGTAYMRDQVDKFGRIEYVAAAYNAGPLRAAQWRTSLPAEIDEWAESIPFKETRGYVQGVVRNRLQYERLYDKDGRFRPEVGSRAITEQPGNPSSTPDPTVRKRRVSGTENEE